METNKINLNAYSKDKIKRIVRIQAAFRGFMARKRVKEIKEMSGTKSMMNHFNFTGPANYENPEVQVRLNTFMLMMLNLWRIEDKTTIRRI